MFTGIVEEVGEVQTVLPASLRIGAHVVLKDSRPGDSISVNGACLTVTKMDDSSFSVDVMPETLRRSNLERVRRGDPVNLERAATLGGRLGGHLVQGHIDATGKVVSMTPEGNAFLLKVSAPPTVTRYLVEKAFVAVDGVSLTVSGAELNSFTMSVVAYTLHNTIIGRYKPNDIVNLEVDIMAKYVEHFTHGANREITLDFLAEHGFTRSG